MRNDVLAHALTHRGMTDEEIERFTREVSEETGFTPGVTLTEFDRRMIYERVMTWRVRIAGSFNEQPAILCLENLKLTIDEELIRQSFRAQAEKNDARVRPPHTYLHSPFDEVRGYGWSIEELVAAPVRFKPEEPPEFAARPFCAFYLELRRAVPHAFWSGNPEDGLSFTAKQLHKWESISKEKFPTQFERFADVLEDLESVLLGARLNAFRFQHAHLAGTDIRDLSHDRHVVFANHFWDWRQEAYDVAFPIWGQWLALPDELRNAQGVAHVTDVWLREIRRSLEGLINENDLCLMLLNRIFGSLLLDVPAQRERRSTDSVRSLETALVAEARRLLV